MNILSCERGPTLNSIRQTDVDTLMIRTQSRVRVRVWVWVRVRVRVIYLNQTGIRHQILGGVGVRVMRGRHLIPSTKLTSSSHKTFHFSYMKFLDEMFIKVKVSSIFKEKNNSG